MKGVKTIMAMINRQKAMLTGSIKSIIPRATMLLLAQIKQATKHSKNALKTFLFSFSI